MPLKGKIAADHIPMNKYKLLVIGLPGLTPTYISGLEEELDTVTLPDRTKASGGNTKPGEFTMRLPLHHLIEQAAMEAWFKESQDPVSPTYKKPATVIYESISGNIAKTYTLVGVFPQKRKTHDAEMSNEGEQSEVEWTMSFDDILPV
jgi:hypothetical protein